ncbi:MAG: pirin family protein [Acidobacteriota bacterium]
MSNLLPSAEAQECSALPRENSAMEALPDRTVRLGALEVHRVLPVSGRRLIGPWCFFDRFGPVSFAQEKPMDVAPHPHIGLQTVTWLFSGEVVHNDSLGSQCLVRPGQLSLMTAGRGIAHTEETPRDNSGKLDGVQLWVALPEQSRAMAPEYQCISEQPVVERPGGRVSVILGEFSGASSKGNQFSLGIGAEIAVDAGARLGVEMVPSFEYGVLLASGDAVVAGVPLTPNTLYYLGSGRNEIVIESAAGARLLLLGGPPFAETIVMWWNFVGRSAEEIAKARASWEDPEASEAIFGSVRRYRGMRLKAPELLGKPIGS